MQNLNTIPIVGTFLDVANRANNNFLAIKTAIDTLELSVTRSKGFFSSASALSTKYPSPVVGDWAVVQVTENNVTQNIIYQCATAGTWSSTNTVWPGGAVDLSEYVQIASIENAPAPDSENPISSGGAWNMKKDVYSEVGKDMRYTEELSGVVTGYYFSMTYDATTHTCTVGTKKSETTNNKKYRVNYYPQTFSKGDIIHFHGEASAQKTQNIGFTTENPALRASLEGLVVDNAFHYSNELPDTIHDYDLIVPYDGAYLVYYYHTDNWTSGTRAWTYYPKGSMKDMVQTLRDDVDADHNTLEFDTLKIIEDDYTNIGSWRSGGTSAKTQGYSDVATVEGETTITIVNNAEGGRFGVVFSTFPLGDYRIEFDFAIVNSGGNPVQRTFSNPIYNAYNNSTSAIGSRVEKYMTEYGSGHYVCRIKHLNTQGFYFAFTIHNYFSTGDVMTVTNFSITRYDRDWGALRNDIADQQIVLDGIVDSLTKEKAVGTKEVTLTPSASETYLAYKTSSGSQFQSSSKRLCYFPKVIAAGSHTVTFRYTGLNTVDVYQLAEKETVGIDDSPVEKYTVAEVMLAHKQYYSKVSPSFDGNVDPDGNITASFVAHKDCSRLAFVMGSTQDTTQTPSNITQNILELTLSVYDSTDIDFSSFAKQKALDDLQERVQANEVGSSEAPPYKSWKKYEMAADGTISYHSNSSTYVIYTYKTPFKKGDRVHFHGEHTHQAGRARRWGMTQTDPMTVSDLRTLEVDMEMLTVSSSVEQMFDDDGNYVKTVIEQDILIGADGYLLTYNYNSNWLLRKSTYYYLGALPSIIEALSENSEGTETDVAQAKFHSEDGNGECLGLLHYGDIHGDSVAAAQIIKYLERHSEHVDDLVTSGDVVNYDVNTNSQITWWRNCGLAEISLFVLGNHDCATKNATEYDQVEAQSGGRAWNGMGKQWGHETFFAPYMSALEIIPPTGFNDPNSQHYKACYWHKDYESQQIRLIGLDCMNYFDGVLDENLNITSAGFKNVSNIGQEVWFAEKLAEAKANDYSVVVMCHYPLDDTDTTPNVSHANILDENGCNTSPNGGFVMNRLTGETANFTISLKQDVTVIDADKRFCLRNRVGSAPFDPLNTWVSYQKGETNNIGNILQRFIDSGGKFVVWLCGHFHTYHMFYPKRYPSVLNLVVGQAGNSRGGSWAYRPTSDPTLRTLTNYVSIDPIDGLIKFIRLGITTNRRLRKVNYLCYDYINKKVISEG